MRRRPPPPQPEAARSSFVEEAARRQGAEARSRELLAEYVDESEWRTYIDKDYLLLTGGVSGNHYALFRTNGQLYRLGGKDTFGPPAYSICLSPCYDYRSYSVGIPAGDKVLAVKLLVEANEGRLIEIIDRLRGGYGVQPQLGVQVQLADVTWTATTATLHTWVQ